MAEEIKKEEFKVIIYDKQLSIDDMEDVTLLDFLDGRYEDMKNATIRQSKEKDWDSADKQFTALSVRDQY
jgi:hypothetical protein